MQNNKNGIWGNEARAEPAGYQKDTSLKKQDLISIQAKMLGRNKA